MRVDGGDGDGNVAAAMADAKVPPSSESTRVKPAFPEGRFISTLQRFCCKYINMYVIRSGITDPGGNEPTGASLMFRLSWTSRPRTNKGQAKSRPQPGGREGEGQGRGPSCGVQLGGHLAAGKAKSCPSKQCSIATSYA